MLNARGYSLAETMVVLVVVSVLSTLAYPGFAQVLARARRTDAVTRLLEVQQAQERWRSNHAAYGSLDDLAISAATAGAAYRVSITAHHATGYTATAEAIGAQAGDVSCRFMRLTMNAGQTVLASGPDEAAANDAATNRTCWRQ